MRAIVASVISRGAASPDLTSSAKATASWSARMSDISNLLVLTAFKQFSFYFLSSTRCASAIHCCQHSLLNNPCPSYPGLKHGFTDSETLRTFRSRTPN